MPCTIPSLSRSGAACEPAVLVTALDFDLTHRLAVHDMLSEIVRQVLVFRRHRLGALPDGFLCAVAEQPLGRAAPKRDLPINVSAHDSHGRCINNRGEHFFRLLFRHLEPRPFARLNCGSLPRLLQLQVPLFER